MLAKHITIYLVFTSYFSFTANIQTHNRAAKFVLFSLIIIGLVGVLFAITATFGKLLWFKDLASQSSAAKHIALYNLMTLLLLPAVTETKITLPSGKPLKIGTWFHRSSRWIIKPVGIEGLLYLSFIFFLSVLPALGIILELSMGQFDFHDMFGFILIALGAMLYIQAPNRCRQDPTHD